MSVDEIRRMPPEIGLLAYRNQRTVLLDLAGWDARRDARDVRAGKAITEWEQRAIFSQPATPAPTVTDASTMEADS